MTDFALSVNPVEGSEQVAVACSIVGPPLRWRAHTRTFDTLEAARKALEHSGVIGRGQMLQTGHTYTLSKNNAISLQVLDRTNKDGQERIFFTFNDGRGGLINQTADRWLERAPLVGEQIPEVSTPLGTRTVKVERIARSQIVLFGDDETRREMDIDTIF